MNMLRLKHLMDRAMPFPKHHSRRLNGLKRIAAQLRFMWVPHGHQVVRDTHLERSVATQMLIGKKEDSAAPAKMTIPKRLSHCCSCKRCRHACHRTLSDLPRIDVSHRGHVFGVDDFAQLSPCRFDLANRCHVRHRTSGCHVRQHDTHALTIASR